MKPVEAGDARVILTGRNPGRVVRVLMPIYPGQYFGEGRRFKPLSNDARQYWVVASLDGKPLIAKKIYSQTTFPAQTVCVSETLLGEIE